VIFSQKNTSRSSIHIPTLSATLTLDPYFTASFVATRRANPLTSHSQQVTASQWTNNPPNHRPHQNDAESIQRVPSLRQCHAPVSTSKIWSKFRLWCSHTRQTSTPVHPCLLCDTLREFRPYARNTLIFRIHQRNIHLTMHFQRVVAMVSKLVQVKAIPFKISLTPNPTPCTSHFLVSFEHSHVQHSAQCYPHTDLLSKH